MLYFLWAILNIGLYFFFLFTCFRAAKLLKENFGLFSAIFFVIGLLSFNGRRNTIDDNNEPHSNKIKTWTFNSIDSLDQGSIIYKNIDLEKTLISTYQLGLIYGKDRQLQNYLPVSASSTKTGFVSGTGWKPTLITVYGTNNRNKLEYEVLGTVTWSLMGMTVYSQFKSWKGFVLLK